MGFTNFPNGVSSMGVPMLPSASAGIRTGTAFFVCNASGKNGSDGNSGLKVDQPLSTVQKAIDLSTATNGDTIYVMPGHAETVTVTNLVCNKAGVAIIGLGVGSTRPTFTFSTVDAVITVSAANVLWSNCRFIGNFADIPTAFVTSAVGTTITDCVFKDNAANTNFLCCVTTGTANNASDGLTFNRNKVMSLPTTDGAVISVLGNLTDLEMIGNNVSKDATSDAGHMLTFSSKVILNAVITDNTLTMKALASQSTGTFCTGSSTTSSGIIARNLVYQIDTSTALFATTGQKFGYIENYMSGAADKSGSIFPAVDDPA